MKQYNKIEVFDEMNIDIVARLPQESTRQYVYRILKNNIMNLIIIPGTALSEQEIANRLSISRTPVREAFMHLAQEHLLDILPQKATYVSLIDLRNMEEAKFMREHLEKAVIKLACISFPDEKLFELQSNISLQELCIRENKSQKFFEFDGLFHGTIFSGCKKDRIWTMIQQISTHYNRVRMLEAAQGYDLPSLLQQHKDLLRAILEKDVELGEGTIDIHLNKVYVDVEQLKKKFSNFFK